MTATQSYLLKALLAEVNGIKDFKVRFEAIAEIKYAIGEVEEKSTKQSKRKKSINEKIQ